jgi:hypothetical protein
LQYYEALQRVLETTNQHICAVNILSDRLARVSTDSHHVKIELPRAPAPGSYADRVRQINRARFGCTAHLVLRVAVEKTQI